MNMQERSDRQEEARRLRIRIRELEQELKQTQNQVKLYSTRAMLYTWLREQFKSKKEFLFMQGLVWRSYPSRRRLDKNIHEQITKDD